MPLTAAFLDTCRTRVVLLAEYAAYNTAGALADGTRAERTARWNRLYLEGSTGVSVANQLRKAIRSTVNAEADKYQTAGSGTVAPLERESAYRTLIGEYCPILTKQPSKAVELAEIKLAQDEELMR